MKEAETMENQKKLLFLGGTGAMYDAVERAKRMGIYTIVVDYYPNSPAKRIADRSYLASTTDIDRVLEIAREDYGTEPPFVVELIVISGILHWNYQIQVLVQED